MAELSRGSLVAALSPVLLSHTSNNRFSFLFFSSQQVDLARCLNTFFIISHGLT